MYILLESTGSCAVLYLTGIIKWFLDRCRGRSFPTKVRTEDYISNEGRRVRRRFFVGMHRKKLLLKKNPGVRYSSEHRRGASSSGWGVECLVRQMQLFV